MAAYFAFMDLAEHLNPGTLRGMPISGAISIDRDEPVVIWRLMVSGATETNWPELKIFRSQLDGSARQRAQWG